MSLVAHWDRQYRCARPPWDSGQPSSELQHVLAEWQIEPCRTLELGCGTGVNALWLAEQGFDVTAVDISPLAIQRARERPVRPGAKLRFLAADLLDSWRLGGPYRFFFDRGCFHALYPVDAPGYLQTLERVLEPGALGLVLTGNANEPEDPGVGPPVLEERELREAFGDLFDFLTLRAFRFDPTSPGGRYLGWSCLLRKQGD